MRHSNKINEKNIISLFDRVDRVKTNLLSDLLTYWETLRGDRIAPSRSDLDPRKIRNVLEHTFVLEKVRNGAPRFRLAGIEVCDLLGMELRGMPGHALFTAENRARFNKTLDEVLKTPQINELTLVGDLAAGQKIEAKMILMPLLDQHGDISRILGGIVIERELMRPPVRFTIQKQIQKRIIKGQEIALGDMNIGFAEHAARFARVTSRPQPVNGRSYLRLVKDDQNS